MYRSKDSTVTFVKLTKIVILLREYLIFKL